MQVIGVVDAGTFTRVELVIHIYDFVAPIIVVVVPSIDAHRRRQLHVIYANHICTHIVGNRFAYYGNRSNIWLPSLAKQMARAHALTASNIVGACC